MHLYIGNRLFATLLLTGNEWYPFKHRSLKLRHCLQLLLRVDISLLGGHGVINALYIHYTELYSTNSFKAVKLADSKYILHLKRQTKNGNLNTGFDLTQFPTVRYC